MPTSASGISFDSHAPKIEQITDSALHGNWEYVAGRFVPGRPACATFLRDSTGDRAQAFLKLVRREISRHLHAREAHAPHYEDLYFACLQIWQDAIAEYTNPMIGRSTRRLRQRARSILRRPACGSRTRTFADLAKAASELIQWAAYEKLQTAITPVNMGTISAVAKATDELDIFSLNHDLLIEAELRSNGVRFADGFKSGDTSMREFDAAWDKAGKRVRLFKLHGSINWYLFTFPRKGSVSRHKQFAAIRGDASHMPKPGGGYYDLVNPEPMFLTGTTIKEQAYGVGLTGELFARFRHRLSQHRTLICCGYGWGDKGINLRLDQWLRDQRRNRIVLLHAGNLTRVRSSKFWTHRWAGYRRSGKLVVVRRFLGQCSLAQLRSYFDRYRSSKLSGPSRGVSPKR